MSLIVSFVGLLVALSIASERLVEIIKGYVPALNDKQEDPRKEGRRASHIQLLAVVAGIITTHLAFPMIKPLVSDALFKVPDGVAVLSLGLLASGGSGFWNAVLGYVTNVKDIKKLDIISKRNAGAG